MITTPKKSTNFRPHPYKTPKRGSPGGHPTIISPSSPMEKATPLKGKLHSVNPYIGKPSPPLRALATPVAPLYFSPLPLHLEPEPTLAAFLEETTHALECACIPLTNEDAIFLRELGRLDANQEFQKALHDARQGVMHSARGRPNAFVYHPPVRETPPRPKTSNKDLAKKRSSEAAQREADRLNVQKLHETPRPGASDRWTKSKKQRATREEREKRALVAHTPAPSEYPTQTSVLLERATAPPICFPITPPQTPEGSQHPSQSDYTPSPTHEDTVLASQLLEKAEEARIAAEHRQAEIEQVMLEKEAKEARALAAAEAEAEYLRHIEGLTEQARIQAFETERQRKVAEEQRVTEENARSQAAKAQRHAHAQAEALRRQSAEDDRLRARREEESRLRAQLQEEARHYAEREAELLTQQRKAAHEACMHSLLQRAEALIQTQRIAFGTLVAHLHTRTTYTDVFIVLVELQRIHEVYFANVQAFREEMARFHVHAPLLAEFYRQQATQLAQEEDFLMQQQYAQKHQQFQPPPAQEGTSDERGASTRDVPMRDASFMDFSMHSVPGTRATTPDDTDMHPAADDMAYDDDIQPPPQSTPPLPPPPPTPVTDTHFFDMWDRDWVAIRELPTLAQVHFSQLPWPVLDEHGPSPGVCVVAGPNDITEHRVQNFIKKYNEHRGLTDPRERRKKVHEWLLNCHSDQSACRVVQKMYPDHQEVTQEILHQCTILLLMAKKSIGEDL